MRYSHDKERLTAIKTLAEAHSIIESSGNGMYGCQKEILKCIQRETEIIEKAQKSIKDNLNSTS